MQEFSSELPEGEKEFNPLEGVKFSLDSVVFECLGSLSILEDSELADMAVAGDTDQSPRGRARLARSLRLAMGAEEYERFRNHCATEPVTPDSVILRVMAAINTGAQENIEAAAERPTEPSPPSSGGPEETGGRSSRVMKLGGDVTTAAPAPEAPKGAAARRKKPARAAQQVKPQGAVSRG